MCNKCRKPLYLNSIGLQRASGFIVIFLRKYCGYESVTDLCYSSGEARSSLVCVSSDLEKENIVSWAPTCNGRPGGGGRGGRREGKKAFR